MNNSLHDTVHFTRAHFSSMHVCMFHIALPFLIVTFGFWNSAHRHTMFSALQRVPYLSVD